MWLAVPGLVLVLRKRSAHWLALPLLFCAGLRALSLLGRDRLAGRAPTGQPDAAGGMVHRAHRGSRGEVAVGTPWSRRRPGRGCGGRCGRVGERDRGVRLCARQAPIGARR